MQSLRRFRNLIVLVALIWLPMTVFAQVCATQCLVISMQTSGVLSRAMDRQSAKQAATSTAAVSGAYASGDSDDHECDMTAVCAFAALIPLAGTQQNLTVSVVRHAVPTVSFLFASYRSIADTPPPRTSL